MHGQQNIKICGKKSCFIIRLPYASIRCEYYVLIIRSPLSTGAPDGDLQSVMIPDAV